METSASFEVRSAPSSYPTDRRATKGRDANPRFHDGRQTVRCSRHCRANLGFAQQHHGLSRYAFSITVAMSGPFQYGSIQRRRCSVQFFAGRRQ